MLLQYPQWFTPKRANRDELARARERLGDLPVCVELRSPRWFGPDDRGRTVGWLADHNCYQDFGVPNAADMNDLLAAATTA